MAGHKVVEDLKRYAVPLDELFRLKYSGFAFRVELNRQKKKENERYEADAVLLKIVPALLNSCGGLVILVPGEDEKELDCNHFNEWETRLINIFNFLPPDEFQRCIVIGEFKPDNVNMYISKVKLFVTTESHMYTRCPASNRHVQQHNDISNILTKYILRDVRNSRGQESHFEQPLSEELPIKGPFTIDSRITKPESANIEFKCFRVKNLEDLWNRIAEDKDKRCCKAIFGMGNVSGGGYIVFGINDANIVKGQNLGDIEEDEQGKFKQKLAELLNIDASGKKRIWGQPGVEPTEGKHWSCDFFPVEGTSRERRRRVVIVINIRECQGGVMDNMPEAFVIDDDGFIAEVDFEYWKSQHLPNQNRYVSANMSPLQQTPSFASLSPTPGQSKDCNNVEADSGSDPLLRRTTQRRISSQGTFEDGVTITYTENSSYSEECKWAWRLSDVQTDASDGPFQRTLPLKCTPSREVLSRVLPYNQREQVIDHIEGATEGKGCVIAADTLFSCIQHAAKLEFLTKFQVGIDPGTQHPPDHIMDLLVISEQTPVTVYVLCEKYHDGQNLYAVALSRLLWKKILEILGTDGLQGGIDTFGIRYCVITTTSTHADITDKMRNKEVMMPGCLNEVCSSLAKLFTGVKNHFRDGIIQSAELRLSKEQTNVLLCTDQSKVSVIEGAPGTGKTLLAQHVCESVGKEFSAYITCSKSLANKVKSNGRVQAFHIKDASEIASLLAEEIMKSRTHLVIDDCQNIQQTRTDCKRIYDHIAAVEHRHVYVFQDSRYQNYEHKSYKVGLGKTLFDYAERDFVSCMFKTLSHIQRNSFTIGSYIRLHAQDLSMESPVTSVTSVTGDNITIRHEPKLRTEDRNNALLRHIQKLTESNFTSRKIRYSFSEIGILCDDHGQKDDGDVKMFLRLFEEYLPESRPRRAEDEGTSDGITIDYLKEFSGLERKVIVYICPKQETVQNVPAHSTLADPRYKIFLFSRAIYRVDILQEENLDEQMANELKCDIYQTKPLRNSQNEVTMFLTEDEDDAGASGGANSNISPKVTQPSQEATIGPIAGSIALNANADILCCFPDKGVETYSVSQSGSVSSTELHSRVPHMQAYSVAVHKTGDVAVAYHPLDSREVHLHTYSKVRDVWTETHLGPGQWPRITFTNRGDVVVCIGTHQMKWNILVYNTLYAKEMWRIYTDCGDINDVAVDSNDQIYCCDSINNGIAIYSENEGSVDTWSPQALNREFLTPVSLCIDGRDSVYVMHREKDDFGNTGVVTMWTHAGQYIKDVVQGLPDPYRLSSACMRLNKRNKLKLIVALYGTIRVYKLA